MLLGVVFFDHEYVRVGQACFTVRYDVVIQRWLVEEYPWIAARAKAEGAEIHWLDETGVNNQAIYQSSFAPKGKPPRTTKPANRKKSA